MPTVGVERAARETLKAVMQYLKIPYHLQDFFKNDQGEDYVRFIVTDVGERSLPVEWLLKEKAELIVAYFQRNGVMCPQCERYMPKDLPVLTLLDSCSYCNQPREF